MKLSTGNRGSRKRNDGGAVEATHCSIPRRAQREEGRGERDFISIGFSPSIFPSRIAINLGGRQGRRALRSRITIKCLTPKPPLLRQLGRSSLNLPKYFMCGKPLWAPRSGVRRIRIGRGGGLESRALFSWVQSRSFGKRRENPHGKIDINKKSWRYPRC